MTLKTIRLAGLACAVAFATVAFSSIVAEATEGKSVAGKVHEVKIRGMTFEPATLEVSAGDTVVWINEDFVPHTATSSATPAAFDSGTLQPKQRWKFVAKAKGTFPYVCTLHPTMVGSLQVR